MRCNYVIKASRAGCSVQDRKVIKPSSSTDSSFSAATQPPAARPGQGQQPAAKQGGDRSRIREAFAWVLSVRLTFSLMVPKKKKKTTEYASLKRRILQLTAFLRAPLYYILFSSSFHRPGDGMGDHHHHHHHVHVDSLRWWLVTGGTKVSFYGLRIKLCT